MFDTLTMNSGLPLRNNCMLYIPMVNDTIPSINRSGIPVTQHDVLREANGHHRFIDRAHLKIPDDLGIIDQFTMGIWFKRKGDPDFADSSGFYHIAFGDVSAELSINPSYAIRCGVRVDGTRYVNNLGEGLISESEWTHLAYTYRNGFGIEAFINGYSVGGFSVPTGLLNTPSSRKIGEYNTNSYGSNAYYRGACIYNRSISLTHIRHLMRFTRP